jgi:outer membrane protein G
MKKILTLALVICSCYFANAQAFKGKGDTKFDVGMTFQDGGSGIMASADFGLGQNLSIGVLSSYLLGGSDIENVDFEYRFDAKVRFSANLSNVLNISEKFDLYPGLNLGLKNFGGHIGARYFFSDGFGVFTEFSTPFAKYDKDATSKFNNGSAFNVGVSFNLD